MRILTPAFSRASFRGLLWASLLVMSACDSSGTSPPPPNATVCTSDAQCGSGTFCDVTGRSAAPLLDPACFFGCVMTEGCVPGDLPCESACATRCGASCPEFCNQVCFDGVELDAECYAECVPACESSPPPPVDAGTSLPRLDAGTPPQGVCRPIAPPMPADGGTPPRPVDAGTLAAPLRWAGAWNLQARYTATCSFGSVGGRNTANLDYIVAMQLAGENSSLTADFSGQYTMAGTGNDTRLTLSGQFPGRDHRGDTASVVMRENNVSITITEVVDDNTARGTLSGAYETRGGIGCTIESGGVIELTR